MNQAIFVTVGSVATLLFLGGTAIQIVGLLVNMLVTRLQVTRQSLSKQGRTEARALLFGAVFTLAISPLVGLAVNQASYWLQHNEPLLGLLLTIGLIFVLLVGGSLAVSAVARINDDDAGTWSSLARDVDDAIRAGNTEPALLRQHEARQNALRAASSSARSNAVVPEGDIDEAAHRLQLDSRNRPLAAALAPFATAVRALRSPQYAFPSTLPALGAATAGLILTFTVVQTRGPIATVAGVVLTLALVGIALLVSALALQQQLIYEVLDRIENAAARDRAEQLLERQDVLVLEAQLARQSQAVQTASSGPARSGLLHRITSRARSSGK